MAATTGTYAKVLQLALRMRARVMRDRIAPKTVDVEECRTFRFLQRVQAGREGGRQDREDGDRGRRRKAALGAVGTVPRNAARPAMMRSG